MLEFDTFRHDIKDAVLYARISSKAQEKKGMGISSQITYCKQYAGWKGYNVHEVFRDSGITGSRADRDGIKSLLAYLKHNKPKRFVVIVDDISRLARDIRVHLDLRDAIDSCDAILESPSMTFGTDSDGRYFENMQALSAQHHREKNAEQTKKRMQARMVDGYWPFPAVLGYKHERVQGHGKIMVPNEPLAAIIRQVLEGYANDTFATQAEVARFLQSQPAFPKTRYGTVTLEAANRILTRVLYTGYIEMEAWNLPLKKAKHEGLITFETFQRIQDKINGKSKAPARSSLEQDFPLRGYVNCSSCDEPMTACWAKGKVGTLYPYYYCHRKGCENKGRSIRRDHIEHDFETLLAHMQPQKMMVNLVTDMFKQAWQAQNDNEILLKKDIQKRLLETDKQITSLLDRIIDADSATVIKAYEKKIDSLEKEKLILTEKIENKAKNTMPFGESFKLTLNFLTSPYNIWKNGNLSHKRTVLKMVFSDRLTYCRKTGFQTPKTSCIFKALQPKNNGESQMADRAGFEPAIRSPVYTLSRRAPSTARPPVLKKSPDI